MPKSVKRFSDDMLFPFELPAAARLRGKKNPPPFRAAGMSEDSSIGPQPISRPHIQWVG
jgi:hypothetical protein